MKPVKYDYGVLFTGEPFPASMWIACCRLCDRPYHIEDRRRRHRYCSHECRKYVRRKHDAQYRKEKLGQTALFDERVCFICSNTFKRVHAIQKTCTPACRRELKRRIDRQWARDYYGLDALADLRCAECDKPFHQKRINQLYCSQTCKRRVNNRRRRKG